MYQNIYNIITPNKCDIICNFVLNFVCNFVRHRKYFNNTVICFSYILIRMLYKFIYKCFIF